MKLFLILICISAIGFSTHKSEAKSIYCFECTTVYDSGMSGGQDYESAGNSAFDRGDFAGASDNYLAANQAYVKAWQAPGITATQKANAATAAVRASNKYWAVQDL